MALVIGGPAPELNLAGDGGTPICLADLRGRKVVVYFYPKDDTAGCTKEALDFNRLLQEFEAAGATVIGVSADSVVSHDRFKTKHGLSLRLASDPDRRVLQAYGVWTEKQMYGRKFMGIERTTVLIDEQGRIAKLWPRVKVPGHALQVLEAVKAL